MAEDVLQNKVMHKEKLNAENQTIANVMQSSPSTQSFAKEKSSFVPLAQSLTTPFDNNIEAQIMMKQSSSITAAIEESLMIKQISIPFTSIASCPSTLQECTCTHSLSLLTHHPLFDDSKINKFKDKIVKHLNDNNIDGQTLSNIPRKKFSQTMIAYCNNDKKVHACILV